MKENFVDVDQLDRRALQQQIPDFHGLGVPVSTIEKGDNLVENIRSCDQQRQRFAQVLPVG